MEKCLRMLTFLPLEEIAELTAHKDERINHAKEILAYEVTRLVHGDEEASKAQEAARAAFSGGASANMPTVKVELPDEGMGIVALMKATGLVPSNGEGFRTIEQGGLSINGEKVSDTKLLVTKEMFKDGPIILKKGKKTFLKVEI